MCKNQTNAIDNHVFVTMHFKCITIRKPIKETAFNIIRYRYIHKCAHTRVLWCSKEMNTSKHIEDYIWN